MLEIWVKLTGEPSKFCLKEIHSIHQKTVDKSSINADDQRTKILWRTSKRIEKANGGFFVYKARRTTEERQTEKGDLFLYTL